MRKPGDRGGRKSRNARDESEKRKGRIPSKSETEMVIALKGCASHQSGRKFT